MMKKTMWLVMILVNILVIHAGASTQEKISPDEVLEQALVYHQVFTGKEATLGNLMYARLLSKPLKDETDGLVQRNSLSLGKDGTYELIKTFSNVRPPVFNHTYRFMGMYSRIGNEATLDTPQSTIALIDWGGLEQTFPNQTGEYSHLDSLAYPRAFNTPFLGDDNGDNDMFVLLNSDNSSFEITGNRSDGERYTMFDAPTARDGLRIYGNFTLPNDSTKTQYPLVVFAHGFAGNHAIQRDVSVMFAQHGIASYRFDFTGGSPFGSGSDGSFYDMSMLTEKDDLLAVLDFVKTQAFVDEESIFVFGESMGGAVAAMVAAQRPKDIKGQLLYYPAFSISEQTRAVYKTETEIPERAGTSAGIMVAKKFYADALTIDIFTEIAGYTGPVLIFHGENDTVVPPLYARKALEVLESAELVLYPDEGHGFSREIKYRTIAKMIEFIDRTVSNRDGSDN